MNKPTAFVARVCGLLSLAALPAAQAATAVFTGPTPYTSSANIPTDFYAGNTPTFLETFEDGNLGGSVTANHGAVYGPASNADSVDADDGSINGSGTAGHSWFYSSGSVGVTFTFNTASLPTAAGIVWTDGTGTVTFSAFDGNGVLLGTLTGSGFADGSFNGTTAEDRFFGVQYSGGIGSIKISNSSGGIEVDHLQYGALPVPEPETYALLLAGLGMVALARRRRAA